MYLDLEIPSNLAVRGHGDKYVVPNTSWVRDLLMEEIEEGIRWWEARLDCSCLFKLSICHNTDWATILVNVGYQAELNCLKYGGSITMSFSRRTCDFLFFMIKPDTLHLR